MNLRLWNTTGRSDGKPAPASGRRRSIRGARGQRLLTIGLALLLVAIGAAASVIAAHGRSRHAVENARAAFTDQSSEVASALKLAIQREQDLVVAGGGYIAGEQHPSNTRFRRWADSVRVLERYPEIQGMAHMVIVPASRLPAYAETIMRDPTGPLPPGGTFRVTPPGKRPFYCVASGAIQRGAGGFPTGFDLCGTPGQTRTAMLTARDSGHSGYLPFSPTTMTFFAPFYRAGARPSTVAERREAFVGTVGITVRPSVLLDRALEGHPDTAVAFHYGTGSSNVAFRAGTAPEGAESTTVDLRNGWRVQTFAAVPATGILADAAARTALLAGLAVSLLLGLIVYLLGTGRARALRLVDVKTGELAHQALHDGLTGLPNRVLVVDRLEQQLVRDRRLQVTGAVLFVDLDGFKSVNDTLGHAVGDRLLVAVAERLQSTLREADTVGRMGGDEFVILIDGVTLEVAPELVAERLLNVLRRPFDVEGAPMPISISASVGIAIGDRGSADDLLRDADVALYEAKAAGKDRYELFHPAMQTEISRRVELEFALRTALERDQFRLVYQPIHELDDLSIVGVEALLRWEHPSLGPVGPEEFIPILEQTAQIHEVGRWVLITACEQMAAWHAQGHVLDLSVNVSGRQLDHDTVIDDIREALSGSGLPATALIVEVTETALMRDAKATAERLRAIKELGVRIAIDDFGTGYSSLSYIQQFPVDCLKIDRSFTSAIAASAESRALISTLVQLGKDLGLATLAEGVETSPQMAHLRDERVEQAQGFLLSGPLEPEVLEAEILGRADAKAAATRGSRRHDR